MRDCFEVTPVLASWATIASTTSTTRSTIAPSRPPRWTWARTGVEIEKRPLMKSCGPSISGAPASIASRCVSSMSATSKYASQ